MRLGQGWARGPGRTSPRLHQPAHQVAGARVDCFPNNVETCVLHAHMVHAACRGRRAWLRQPWAAGGIRARHAAGTRASAPLMPHSLPSACLPCKHPASCWRLPSPARPPSVPGERGGQVHLAPAAPAGYLDHKLPRGKRGLPCWLSGQESTRKHRRHGFDP